MIGSFNEYFLVKITFLLFHNMSYIYIYNYGHSYVFSVNNNTFSTFKINYLYYYTCSIRYFRMRCMHLVCRLFMFIVHFT